MKKIILFILLTSCSKVYLQPENRTVQLSVSQTYDSSTSIIDVTTAVSPRYNVNIVGGIHYDICYGDSVVFTTDHVTVRYSFPGEYKINLRVLALTNIIPTFDFSRVSIRNMVIDTAFVAGDPTIKLIY